MIENNQVRPRYNVAPTQQVLVVATSSDGQHRRLGSMRWGLVPSWAKDISIGNKMINARTDKVRSSNAYRAAFAKRRCIIPANGFYEWSPSSDRSSTAKKMAKTPFHIHAHTNIPLALAGLWEVWRDAEGNLMRSCTILTTDANATISPIHHRMPVILAGSDWEAWLAPRSLSLDEGDRLFTPAPNDLLDLDEVSPMVNRPANDTPELIRPISSKHE